MSLKGENITIQDRFHGQNQVFFVFNRQYHKVYT
jgi:hypothetical protein